MSLETKPQMKKPELVSSQAQSLTKKYQETKELLQLQELKKRNMQAQLGLSLSHLCTKEPYLSDTQKSSTSEILSSSLVTKSVTFVLLDNEGKIRELEGLIDCSKPLSVKELTKLLHCHTDSVVHEFPEDSNEHNTASDITKCQKLLETLKNRQDMENETVRKSLARAGDSIRDYEARLITMEDMLGRVQKSPYMSPCQQDDSAQMSNHGLSQRVALLTSENEALNQRYQEIVNQLREADREIDRLKAELQSGQQYQRSRVDQDVTELGDREFFKNLYEQEVLDKSQKLEEALLKLEVLGNSLKDTEKKLQLKEATLKGLGFQVPGNEKDYEASESEKGHLRQRIEVIESKLSEKERMLQSVEQICRELRAQNMELQLKKQEAEQTFNQALLEAKEDVRKLRERDGDEIESANEYRVDGKCQDVMPDDDGEMGEVLEDYKRRSDALRQVLAMLMKSSDNEYDDSSVGFEESSVGRNLTGGVIAMFEHEILGRVLSDIENSQGKRDCEQAVVVRNVVERMLVENKILTSMSKISPVDTEHAETQADKDTVGGKKINDVIIKQLVETLQCKVALLNQFASTINEPANEQFRSLLSSYEPQTPWSRCIQDAIVDVTRTYFLLRQRFQTDVVATAATCAACSQLKEQNLELKLKLDQMVTQTSSLQNLIADGSNPVTHIHIEGEPIDSLDKAIQLQDMVAKHKKELREVREAFEREAAKLKEEVSKSEETLRLRSEENVKEIDSLTICMENLKKKHELDRSMLVEHFTQDLAELNNAMGTFRADLPDDGQLNSASQLKLCIQKLVAQVSEETKRREREEDTTLLRLKYEKDLENLKVVVFLVLFCSFPSVMACEPLWQLPTCSFPPPHPQSYPLTNPIILFCFTFYNSSSSLACWLTLGMLVAFDVGCV